MIGTAPSRRPPWLPILAVGLAVTAAILVAVWLFPALLGAEIGPRVVYLVILPAALLVSFRRVPIRAGTVFRAALLWIALGAAVLLAYDLWTDPPAWLAAGPSS